MEGDFRRQDNLYKDHMKHKLAGSMKRKYVPEKRGADLVRQLATRKAGAKKETDMLAKIQLRLKRQDERQILNDAQWVCESKEKRSKSRS
jgi:hypothetical protein